MDQPIARAGNPTPGYLAKPGLHLVRNFLYRLTDNLEVSDDGILCPRVRDELVVLEVTGVVLDSPDGLEDVLQQCLCPSFRHRWRCS